MPSNKQYIIRTRCYAPTIEEYASTLLISLHFHYYITVPHAKYPQFMKHFYNEDGQRHYSAMSSLHKSVFHMC